MTIDASSNLSPLVRQLSTAALSLDRVAECNSRAWLTWSERRELERQREREARKRLRELRDRLNGMRLE